MNQVYLSLTALEKNLDWSDAKVFFACVCIFLCCTKSRISSSKFQIKLG